MDKHIRFSLILVGMFLFGVFIGWMFGYNFDYRNQNTGIFTVIWCLVSAFVAGIDF